MLADDVVDAAVLLRVREAEVAAQHVAEKERVLLEQGAVEPVARFEIGADLGVDDLLAAQRIAGHGVHRDERRGRDEPDRDDPLNEPLQNVDEHRASDPRRCRPSCSRATPPWTRRPTPFSRASCTYMTPRSYARIVAASSMRMRWISRECFEPHALVERLLGDAHLRVELRIVVAAVVVQDSTTRTGPRTSTDRRSRDSSRRS